MYLLLYVHVCVTRTGWKTRPRPKTIILPIKKSNQIKSNLPLPLPFLSHLMHLRQLSLLAVAALGEASLGDGGRLGSLDTWLRHKVRQRRFQLQETLVGGQVSALHHIPVVIIIVAIIVIICTIIIMNSVIITIIYVTKSVSDDSSSKRPW